jgi:hypothetical protein
MFRSQHWGLQQEQEVLSKELRGKKDKSGKKS